MHLNSNFHVSFNQIQNINNSPSFPFKVYVLVPISKRVQNLVNAALGKMGKTSLREQKGRLQQKQLAVVSSWIGGCSLLSKSLKAKLKQDDGCDDDDADIAAAVAANRLIMLVNPIVPLALALTFNNSQKSNPESQREYGCFRLYFE